MDPVHVTTLEEVLQDSRMNQVFRFISQILASSKPTSR